MYSSTFPHTLMHFTTLWPDCIEQFTIWREIFADAPQFQKQGQTATPGTSCPTRSKKCVGSLTSPADQYREDTGEGAYGLLSLSEKKVYPHWNHYNVVVTDIKFGNLHSSMHNEQLILIASIILSMWILWIQNPIYESIWIQNLDLHFFFYNERIITTLTFTYT